MWGETYLLWTFALEFNKKKKWNNAGESLVGFIEPVHIILRTGRRTVFEPKAIITCLEALAADCKNILGKCI